MRAKQNVFLLTVLCFLAAVSAHPESVATRILAETPLAASSDLLLVDLSADLQGGVHRVDFEAVGSSGGVIARESVNLPSGLPEGVRCLEVFSTQPGTVKALLGGAYGRSDEVLVRLSIDGVEQPVLTLRDLQLGTEQLLKEEAIPFPITVRIEGAGGSLDSGAQALGAAATLTCEDVCWLYYDQCESGCGTPPAEECLQRCDASLESCLEGCPVCPSTRDYTVVVPFSETYLGPTQCRENYLSFGSGRLYDRINRTDKATLYRETTYCDGSKTTVVVSVSYPSYVCWRPGFPGCYPYGSIFGYFLCL